MAVRTLRLAGLALAGGALLLSGQTLPAQAAGPAASAVGGDALGRSGVQVAPGPDTPALPTSGARSWVVADAGTGEVLAAKNAHLRRLPASTLKVLTALTLIPTLDPDLTYRATYADAAIEGSKVGIVPGATYTVDQLLQGLMLASGNDTALALARANGGVRRTVAMMNAEAQRLGAADTVVRNTSGLDHPEQLTSAYDLALVARAALALPEFREYVSTVSTSFPGAKAARGKKRPTFMVYNHNPLLRKQYRGAIGVKTGFTAAAGRTFIGAAERRGHTLVVTLMGYRGDTYTEAANLLDWGFKAAGGVEPVGHLVDPQPVEDDGDDEPDSAGPVDDVPGAALQTAGGGTPAWPFVVIGAPLALLALAAVTASMRRPASPLAAANRGLGRGRGRGRRSGYGGGPRRY